jgi:hypothetical protein
VTAFWPVPCLSGSSEARRRIVPNQEKQRTKKANAQVNRRQCEALTSELNLQLGWWQVLMQLSYS